MSTNLGGNQDDDQSYNRIRIPGDLKSQICSQIADSSESLLLEEEEDDSSSYPPATVSKTTAGSSATKANTAGSKLSQSVLSSDIATPTPERPNPLEQVPTQREGDIQDTPSPVRSHEQVGHTQPVAKRISNMITDEDSEVENGDDVSRQTTLTQNSGDGKRPKMGARPSTMRRLTSAIKRTVNGAKS